MMAEKEAQSVEETSGTVLEALAAAKQSFNEVIPNEIDLSQLRGKHPLRFDATQSAISVAFEDMPDSVLFNSALSFTYEEFYTNVLADNLATRAPDETTTRKYLLQAGFEKDESGGYWKRSRELRHGVIWHGSFPDTEDFQKITTFYEGLEASNRTQGWQDRTLELNLNADISIELYEGLKTRRELLAKFLVLVGNALIQENRASCGGTKFVGTVLDTVKHQRLISEMDEVDPSTNTNEYLERSYRLPKTNKGSEVYICGLRQNPKQGSSILEFDADLIAIFDASLAEPNRRRIPISAFGGSSRTIYLSHKPLFDEKFQGPIGKSIEALNDTRAFDIICELVRSYAGDTTLEVVVDDYLSHLTTHLMSVLKHLDTPYTNSQDLADQKAENLITVVEHEVQSRGEAGGQITPNSTGSGMSNWSQIFGKSVASMLASHRPISESAEKAPISAPVPALQVSPESQLGPPVSAISPRVSEVTQAETRLMPFGQIVIGPPGSGKSTYCAGAHQFLSGIGRKVSIVNLDPANESISYPCAVNVMDLVNLNEIMAREGLGPNGGIIYALETLEENFDWLEYNLNQIREDYIIFDLPGQVELFTHNSSLRNIVAKLEKLGYRLVVVHLVDAHYCTDPAKYISVLMLALRSMLQLELPHINVLSKIDLLNRYSGALDFNLDFYTEVQDLTYLLPRLNLDPRLSRFSKLNEAIIDLIQDFSLVQFDTLCVEDKTSMARLLQQIDKAGGYAYGEAEIGADTVWTDAVRGGWLEGGSLGLRDQERWITSRDEYDVAERVRWQQEGRRSGNAINDEDDEEMS